MPSWPERTRAVRQKRLSLERKVDRIWNGAGLASVETLETTVQRTFSDFDDYWTTILGGPSVGPQLAAMSPSDLAVLKTLMSARLPADAAGRITYNARANAVKGRLPN